MTEVDSTSSTADAGTTAAEVVPADGAVAVARTFPIDKTLAAAVDTAREAAVEVGGDSVGEHLGARAEDERVVSHAFAADVPGYSGWYWSVTLVRVSRAKTITVDEVVLLPGADRTTAVKMLEELRLDIAGHDWTPTTGGLPVTASIGVASAPEDATERAGLLAVADRRLYAAKDAGRDRVVS